MTITRPNNHTVTITFEPGNFDRLYSPDGRLHLLPCDCCGAPQWVSPVTDAVICSACANALPSEGGVR